MRSRVYIRARILPRHVLIVLIAAVSAAGIMVSARPAGAVEVLKTVRFSETTFQRGYTFTDPSKQFKVWVEKNTFDGPAVLTVERMDETSVPELSGLSRTSGLFRVTASPRDEGQVLQILKPIRFEFVVVKQGFYSRVGKLSTDGASWEELGTMLVSGGRRARSADDKATFTVAAFQNDAMQEGIATYYGTYTRKTKLTMVAASNTYPYGSWLKVTNLDNDKSVKVKVVDTGGFAYPTVVDLSTPSFAKIQTTWKGVARVRVEPTEPDAEPVTPEPVPDEPPPVGAPVLDGATPPTTAAFASIVVDVATGTRLVGKHDTDPMPIASLTKLITASVFMDTKPDLNAVVTYSSADDTTCSCLRLKDGEQVSLKDLLFGSLVGSANNATLALVRATGMTKAQFVQKMNEKAATLGLGNTSFVEPTGLDSGNVSTAQDIATLMRVLPNANKTIRKALATSSYKFTSKNNVCRTAYQTAKGTCVHSFKSTNLLFGKTSYTIAGAKTGYIDESRHTFALRGKNAEGRELVAVLLKVYNKGDLFKHSDMLMNWSFSHVSWM